MNTPLEFTDILISLGLTVFFAGLIGYERQKRHKIAGLTTHLLVALGAAGLSLVQETLAYDALQLVQSNPDLIEAVVIERQRIVAQIVSGVGFLGTGAILKTKGSISGLLYDCIKILSSNKKNRSLDASGFVLFCDLDETPIRIRMSF